MFRQILVAIVSAVAAQLTAATWPSHRRPAAIAKPTRCPGPLSASPSCQARPAISSPCRSGCPASPRSSAPPKSRAAT